MAKIPVTLLFLVLVCSATYGQNTGTVKGFTFDTATNKPVPNATITIMKITDSSLVTFTMADNSGAFTLTGIAAGDYRALITHVNYHSTNVFFTISKHEPNVDIGKIILTDRSKVLKEVVVTTESSPVTLIGDTIQYNAGSFKRQPNANVEDLLKKLPGVKVDKEGTIKAQGEKVQKVLVDGKEFFSNDPKIATRNLPADAIDKVQVYDKLSDQAQMTGFDDGNSEKTINLTLKKDKKKGTFGKINAGIGTGDKYQGKFNDNSFKGARQMSAIGMANNTNAEGFSFFDILNFTGAISQLKNGGGNINLSISQDDPIAGLLGGNNKGVNTTWGGGLNYNNLIGNKTDFQGNYFYSHYNPVRKSTVQRQYFSPSNLYTQNSYADNLSNSNRLNFSADHQLDSFNSIKFSGNINHQQTAAKGITDYATLSGQGKNINEGTSNTISNNEGANVVANLLFKKKFHKRGRTFSLNILGNFNNSMGNGNLHSLTDFYDTGGMIARRDSIDQVSNSSANLDGVNVKAVYTEPVFKKSLLEFSIGESSATNTTRKTTYDYNHSSGKFDLINTSLTNDFKNTYGYTNGGLKFRKQTKKYNFSMGASWQAATLEGKIISGLKDSSIKKTFTNILPNARFQYNFSRFKNIVLNYSTNTNQPTVSQLQPLPDNTNPLYIKQGNPGLKPEFVHSLRMMASIVDPFKNRSLFAFFTVQQTRNKIVDFDKINSFGVDSVTPVNVDGVFNMNGNISYGFPIRFLKGTMDINTDISSYQGKQFVNGEKNLIKTNTIGPVIRLDMNPSGKLNVSLSAGLNFSETRYSLKSARSAKYLTQEYNIEAGWQLPKGIFLSNDFNYRIIRQYQNGFNAKVPLWNASISKQMLHFNRGELKLSANDLLNRNLSINRNANQNYIEDTRVNNLRRFFLLSFTYNLAKTGLNNAGNGGGVKMIR